MTEEVKEPEVKEPEEVLESPEPEVNDDPPAPSAMELAAREQGWMPQEDWVAAGKDPDEWRSAREFVDRGELLKQLHNVKRTLKQNTEETAVLRAHHQRVYEAAYQNAVKQLRLERRQALADDDFERADEIEEQIDSLKEQRQKEKIEEQPKTQAGPPPEFQEWQARNPWYDNDPELHESADAFGIVYASKNPNASPSEVYAHVEQRIKQVYPHKFQGRQTAPSPVAGVSGRARPNKPAKETIVLTEDEQKAMQSLVKRGHMTEEAYIRDIKMIRGE